MSRRPTDWKLNAFDGERRGHEARQLPTHENPPFIKRDDGWVLFGPPDVRAFKRHYYFSLTMLYCDRQLRVRVACKYMTLDQAWRHCIAKGRRGWRRNQYQQAIAIIRLMVLQAQAYKLPHMPLHVRFDSSVVKRRK